MERLFEDLRHGIRMLRKSPGFSAVAVLTLALGIGASTTMFGVMNAILLRPLPFDDPDRLVRILSTKGDSVTGPSPLDTRDFGAQNHTFEQVVVYDTWRKNVSANAESSEPEQLPVGLVPAEYFEVLKIQPLLGRLFTAAENRWGENFVAVLSYDYWQTHYGGDPSAVGKTVTINDERYNIIGIMPDSIPSWWLESPHGRTELWTPFAPYATVWDETARGNRDFSSIGRLRPGVTLEQGQADLQRIANNLAAHYPLDREVSVVIRPLADDRVGGLRPVVVLLTGAVLLILLIACSNVANLLLARNSDRGRELALRMALGAGKPVLMRQAMAEALTLGLLAGGVGCLLAWTGCATLAHVHPTRLPQLSTVEIDFRVLIFALAISLISSVFFGAFPAWVSSRVNLLDSLKEGGRTNAPTKGRQLVRRLFVVSEMAFAVMLLVGTGLLVQSLLHLQEQRTGFRVDHLLREHLYLPTVRYPNPVNVTHFSDDYSSRVRQLPGVEEATISAAYPPDDQWIQNFTIENRPASRLQDVPTASFNVTDSHYLHTLGIPLLKGRNFSDSDTDTSVPVALVNQAFVSSYFPLEDPIGKQIRLGLPQPMVATSAANTRLTIVGVIGNWMNRGLALPPEPEIVTLYRQIPDLNYGFKNLIVRTALDPLQLASPIRAELHALDANLPFAEVSTMDDIMAEQTADRRYTTGLLILFAACGVLLAVIGVYGVVSYSVTQRTGEIGLRMALGARREDVVWLVVRQGLGMAAIGSAIGLTGAWIFRQAVARLVFGVSPADPLTFAIAAFLLMTFAVAACVLPARRAASTDPMLALRWE
jgi:putative ABC transport system permease protein